MDLEQIKKQGTQWYTNVFFNYLIIIFHVFELTIFRKMDVMDVVQCVSYGEAERSLFISFAML